MTSIYIVFTREENVYPAHVTDDLDKAKQTAKDLNGATGHDITVEEWPIDGPWFESTVVYQYPEEEEQPDEATPE